MVDSILNIPSIGEDVFTTNSGGFLEMYQNATGKILASTEEASSNGFGDFSNAESAMFGLNLLGNVLRNIAGYNAAKNNYNTVVENAARTQAATDYNIGLMRRDTDRITAYNRSITAKSGLSARSFTAVERSNLITSEQDIATMLAMVSDSVYSQKRAASKAKYKAKNAALLGTIGSFAGAAAGVMTGNPMAVIAGSNIGNSLGSSIGGGL